MEYRKLIGSDLLISRITLGCEQMGGTDWGDYNENELYNTIQKSLEFGINTFDTADVYGLGKSEEFLERVLKNVKNEVVIISKFGVSWKKLKNKKRAKIIIDGSPLYLVKALEGSLKRLKIESLPIYFYHKPDKEVPIYETLEAMQKQKQLGKIQNIGVSNFSIDLLKEANETGIINCVQISCSLLEYDKMKPILEYCKSNKLNVFTYGALAHGLLTGKYNIKSTFSKNDRRHRLSLFKGTELEFNLKVVEKMEYLAKELNVTIPQIALKYLINKSEITSVIVGAKTPKQIKSNIESIDKNITDDHLSILN